MRYLKILSIATLAALTVACGESAAIAPPPAKAVIGDFGIDETAMDPAVNPGDDFFRFVNGSWLDTFEIPPDRTRYGAFDQLRERSEEQVDSIVSELTEGIAPPGSVEQKIRDYYASYMDTDAIEAAGIDVLAPELEKIRAIKGHQDLATAFGAWELSRWSTPLAVYADIDRLDPSRWILSVGTYGLGLPDRDYYLEDTQRFRKIRDQYVRHIATMLGFVGHDDPAQAAEAVLALETRMAEAHWPRTKRRNRDLTYNMHTFAELEAAFPDFDWQRLFAGYGKVPTETNVMQPSAIQATLAIIRDTPIDTWQSYLTHHLIRSNAFMLPAAVDDASFEFYGKVLYGREQQRERWRRGVSLVGGGQGLGEAIGQVYAERYFPPEAKDQMLDLVEHLRVAFGERIDELGWMSPKTKVEAKAKLAGFLPKIGYPDEWRDYSGLTIVANDLAANVAAVRKFHHDYELAELEKPTDRQRWWATPQTVNAFYSSQFNAITFPAGILQPPFFDPNAGAAVNYGAIGAVIGHEMGHGFDDQGSKFDGDGVQRNWWQDEDRQRFEVLAAGLVEQYSAYSPLDGHAINGELTLGENIGDLGGLAIAYRAHQLRQAENPEPVINGFTPDQRFFMSFAQVWRAKARDEYLLATLKSDTHSPPEFRTNGSVRNLDAWYEAFDVEPDDALYLAPEARVSIW